MPIPQDKTGISEYSDVRKQIISFFLSRSKLYRSEHDDNYLLS
ncbi:hypothetical protein DSUL_50192 [Desulfovibrionales bacterium]